MVLEKTVTLNSSVPSFQVIYNEREFGKLDTRIDVYKSHKISIVLTDGLAAICSGKITLTEVGDILFFRTDEPHFARMLRAGTHAYLDFYIPTDFFDFFTDGKVISEFMLDSQADRINKLSPDEKNRARIIELCQTAKGLLSAPENSSATPFYSFLLEILLILSGGYKAEKKKTQGKDIPTCVKRTLSFISKHYAEEITLTELAKECSCSITYLSRTFKKYVGSTIYGYIIDFRIEEAKRLLERNSAVTEACYAVGFSDTSNFIKTFREKTGTTPSRFKRKA